MSVRRECAEIEMIFEELGYLTLAVTLAGSYVSEMDLELDIYPEKYRHRRKELFDEKPDKHKEK